MFRFFVDKKQNDYFVLNRNVLQHIKVSRIQNKEFICVYNSEFYICTMDGEVAKIKSKLDKNNEFNEEVIIVASIIKTKRFEWLIQKATELGATKLIPCISKNVTQKLGNDISKKIKRWNEISINAAEQSFRNNAMIVEEPMKFSDILKMNVENKFIAHEKETDNQVKLLPTKSLFLIGPEGGFTSDEIEEANKNSFKTISLGKRILRAETASIFILSRINE